MAERKTNTNTDERTDAEVLDELEEPPMFAVWLLDDDYTSMDFVVMVLETVFHKDHNSASKIMMDVHKKGKGICGIYTREIAETKIKQVSNLAEKSQYPLRCTMEVA